MTESACSSLKGPAGGVKRWRVTQAFVDKDLVCASTHLCLSVSGSGVTTSTSPTRGAAAWHLTQLTTTLDPNPSAACGSPRLCIALDNGNDVLPSGDFCAAISSTDVVSATASGMTSAAPLSEYSGSMGLTQIACASAALKRLDRHPAPHRRHRSAAHMPVDLSCMIVSATTVEATTDPTDSTPHWTVISLPTIQIATTAPPGGPVPPFISGVSCASTTACVAVDRQGGYAFVGNPMSGTWTATKIDYGRLNPVIGPPSLTGVSCAPSGQCVAVDGLGFAFIGQISG